MNFRLKHLEFSFNFFWPYRNNLTVSSLNPETTNTTIFLIVEQSNSQKKKNEKRFMFTPDSSQFYKYSVMSEFLQNNVGII